MKIMRSINEIIKNGSNFKSWEVEQDNIDQKREELNKKHPPSKEELKQAKALGGTIIDVVDIMDQHSEDIAENVETLSSIPMGVFPSAVAMLTGFASWKFLMKPAGKEYSRLEKKFMNDNSEKIDKLLEEFKTENPKEKDLFKYDILNKHVIKKLKASENAKKEAAKLSMELIKLAKGPLHAGIIGIIIPVASSIVAFIGGNIYATKLQVDSSKVSRFQFLFCNISAGTCRRFLHF